jgi:hypothetical protein
MTRRTILGAAAAAGPMLAQNGGIEPAVVQRHDAAVERYLQIQVTDPASRWLGGIPDETELHNPGAAAGAVDLFTAAYLCPQSKFHADQQLVQRIRLAAGYLLQSQSPQGNIDLLITNFNSPPDTAFSIASVGPAAVLAKRARHTEIFNLIAPYIRNAARGLAQGGVHTPNHRWVVCAALAQIHELFPDPALVRRIDQWLAEGIDIDEDGQFNERSTSVYNPVTDRALVVMAHKLQRPELLEYVRRNLESMMYLLHPGYEVVTEISRRQDQYARANVGQYWFPLKYLAIRDGNGRYEYLASRFAPQRASLSTLMEYPELQRAGPAPVAPPEDYEKLYPVLRVARVRRGATSATVILDGNSRFLTLRRGEAVLNAVRFASAFFGKAQFIPQRGARQEGAYHLEQQLEGPYFQPFDGRKVDPEKWNGTRGERRRSEICRLTQAADVRELPNGFRVRMRAFGTDKVPVAVEINFREGGELQGCAPVPKIAGAWVLGGRQAEYRAGSDAIRFGPGLREHLYTQVRGAEPKLPGTSAYLCGYTPFDHTLTFEW